jgi:hypothetical protein
LGFGGEGRGFGLSEPSGGTFVVQECLEVGVCGRGSGGLERAQGRLGCELGLESWGSWGGLGGCGGAGGNEPTGALRRLQVPRWFLREICSGSGPPSSCDGRCVKMLGVMHVQKQGF